MTSRSIFKVLHLTSNNIRQRLSFGQRSSILRQFFSTQDRHDDVYAVERGVEKAVAFVSRVIVRQRISLCTLHR